MARRTRRYSSARRAPARRSSFRGAPRRTSRSSRSSARGGGRQRLEIVVRQEPAQGIAMNPQQFVQDGGHLKMIDPNGPKKAKF